MSTPGGGINLDAAFKALADFLSTSLLESKLISLPATLLDPFHHVNCPTNSDSLRSFTKLFTGRNKDNVFRLAPRSFYAIFVLVLSFPFSFAQQRLLHVFLDVVALYSNESEAVKKLLKLTGEVVDEDAVRNGRKFICQKLLHHASSILENTRKGASEKRMVADIATRLLAVDSNITDSLLIDEIRESIRPDLYDGTDLVLRLLIANIARVMVHQHAFELQTLFTGVPEQFYGPAFVSAAANSEWIVSALEALSNFDILRPDYQSSDRIFHLSSLEFGDSLYSDDAGNILAIVSTSITFLLPTKEDVKLSLIEIPFTMDMTTGKPNEKTGIMKISFPYGKGDRYIRGVRKAIDNFSITLLHNTEYQDFAATIMQYSAEAVAGNNEDVFTSDTSSDSVIQCPKQSLIFANMDWRSEDDHWTQVGSYSGKLQDQDHESHHSARDPSEASAQDVVEQQPITPSVFRSNTTQNHNTRLYRKLESSQQSDFPPQLDAPTPNVAAEDADMIDSLEPEVESPTVQRSQPPTSRIESQSCLPEGARMAIGDAEIRVDSSDPTNVDTGERLRDGHKRKQSNVEEQASPPVRSNNDTVRKGLHLKDDDDEVVAQDSYPVEENAALTTVTSNASFAAKLSLMIDVPPTQLNKNAAAISTPFGNRKKFVANVNAARSVSPHKRQKKDDPTKARKTASRTVKRRTNTTPKEASTGLKASTNKVAAKSHALGQTVVDGAVKGIHIRDDSPSLCVEQGEPEPDKGQDKEAGTDSAKSLRQPTVQSQHKLTATDGTNLKRASTRTTQKGKKPQQKLEEATATPASGDLTLGHKVSDITQQVVERSKEEEPVVPMLRSNMKTKLQSKSSYNSMNEPTETGCEVAAEDMDFRDAEGIRGRRDQDKHLKQISTPNNSTALLVPPRTPPRQQPQVQVFHASPVSLKPKLVHFQKEGPMNQGKLPKLMDSDHQATHRESQISSRAAHTSVRTKFERVEESSLESMENDDDNKVIEITDDDQIMIMSGQDDFDSESINRHRQAVVTRSCLPPQLEIGEGATDFCSNPDRDPGHHISEAPKQNPGLNQTEPIDHSVTRPAKTNHVPVSSTNQHQKHSLQPLASLSQAEENIDPSTVPPDPSTKIRLSRHKPSLESIGNSTPALELATTTTQSNTNSGLCAKLTFQGQVDKATTSAHTRGEMIQEPVVRKAPVDTRLMPPPSHPKITQVISSPVKGILRCQVNNNKTNTTSSIKQKNKRALVERNTQPSPPKRIKRTLSQDPLEHVSLAATPTSFSTAVIADLENVAKGLQKKHQRINQPTTSFQGDETTLLNYVKVNKSAVIKHKVIDPDEKIDISSSSGSEPDFQGTPATDYEDSDKENATPEPKSHSGLRDALSSLTEAILIRIEREEKAIQTYASSYNSKARAMLDRIQDSWKEGVEYEKQVLLKELDKERTTLQGATATLEANDQVLQKKDVLSGAQKSIEEKKTQLLRMLQPMLA